MYEISRAYCLTGYDGFTRNDRKVRFEPVNSEDIYERAVAGVHPFLYRVSSYNSLMQCISFLTVMNKRHALFYRGQTDLHKPLIPTIFRPSYRHPFSGDRLKIDERHIALYQTLRDLEGDLQDLLEKDYLTPRRRTTGLYSETLWSIIQHYELWPTPLIDLSQSLSVAVSFALLDDKIGTPERTTGQRARDQAYLFVVGMPNLVGSITFDTDQQLMLARLQATCPPSALRPHNQEAFLAGRFPFNPSRNEWPQLKKKSDLRYRIVQVFELDNSHHAFWDDAPAPIPLSFLLPDNRDTFRGKVNEHFRSKITTALQSFERA